MMGIGVMELVLLFGFGGGFGGLPFGLPPLAPEPRMQSVAPEECLAYFAWNGTAKADAKSKNHTEQLLAEEELNEFLAQLEKEIRSAIKAAAKGNPDAGMAADIVPDLVKIAATRPTVLYLSRLTIGADRPDLSGAIVVSVGKSAPQVRESVGKIESLIEREARLSLTDASVAGVKFRKMPVHPNAPTMMWGWIDDYFVFTIGDKSADEFVARWKSNAKPAAWLTKLHKDLPVDRVSIVNYWNVAGILKACQPLMTDPKVPQVMEALGVANLKSIASVSGLDANAATGRMQVVLDGPAKGLFALVSDKGITAADLKSIPADATSANVFRFSLTDVLNHAFTVVGQLDPTAKAQMEQGLAQIEANLGVSLRGDLLGGLGDVWSVYAPADAGTISGVMPNLVITVNVRDQAKVAKAQDALLNVARAAIEQSGPRAGITLSEFTSKAHRGHTIQFQGIPIPLTPTWVLTKDQFIIGINSQVVKSHLAHDPAKSSLATNPAVAAAFSRTKNPVLVSYSDPLPGLQNLYTLVQSFGPLAVGQLAQAGVPFNLPALPLLSTIKPHLVPSITTVSRTATGLETEHHGILPGGGSEYTVAAPVAIALLLPAVQQSREAARRTQSRNNLKQIGLAMHNFHDVHNSFPPAASSDKAGKSLLSWRVQILPFIDQAPLYKEFHHDEPWDSEHNKKLIPRMPPSLGNPNLPKQTAEGKTVYLAPVGKGLAFEGTKGLGIREFTDGTSNTLLVVEAHADKAVIWTKPDDLAFDPEKPLDGLKDARAGGFQVLFCDGSVRFISQNLDLVLLRSLFTRNGGEAVSLP